MRIRGAKTDLEKMDGDTEGMASSTAKLQKEMLALSGIDIMKDNNSFKETEAIMDELATKWQDLTDIQQASITELIAGKRQGNVLSALLNNYDIARDTIKTAENSDGSALRELENYKMGIGYALDNFKAQFQEFSTTAIGSDFFKGLVDSGTSALGMLTQIIDKVGMVGTLGAAAGLLKTAKGGGKSDCCSESKPLLCSDAQISSVVYRLKFRDGLDRGKVKKYVGDYIAARNDCNTCYISLM